MITLIIFVLLAIVVSFYCSLLESAFLSITPAYVKSCEVDAPRKGRQLAELKNQVDKPLAAILSLNTVAHTLGATGAGAQAIIVFGNEWIALFSALLTFAILILSEVIPKTLGATYWRELSSVVAKSLPVLVIITYPLVWISVKISNLLNHQKPRQVMRGELQALARIGKDEGAISSDESAFIESLMKFRDVKVDSVMTPLSVVESLPESEDWRQAIARDIPFSRIPVYQQEPSKITGYVLKDDLHDAGLDDDQSPRDILHFKRPIVSINAKLTLPHAIRYFSKNRTHIAVASDEEGNAMGIITLEDTLETLLGWEIVDEFDPAPDMRKLASELDTS